MVHYKLIYFTDRGLGEVSRLIFHYANIEFENVLVDRANEWPTMKSNTPYGHLPILEVDGIRIAESFAIARYLARTYGLAGKDDFESAQIDSIADFVKDFLGECRSYIMALRGRGPGDKSELKQNEFRPSLKKNIPVLEKRLQESGSGFFAKSGVSWVDFFVANVVETITNLDEETMKNFEEISAHKERVYNLPQLKKYLENRPKTPF